ncbi:MAG: DUF2914 domain-containing protein [Maribacter sp.]|nr:DUF2914 domain-containing protein [Maribacter sp.]
MKRVLVKFRNSRFRGILRRYEKYAPIVFFMGGFILDSLTLGRIDRLYDLIVLCLYMALLTVTIYLYNLADDGKWKNTFLEAYEDYFPLAIQFFFGGLSSAYVVYFSRSVSLSKTVSFFVILVLLLFANELLKKRISNKYLQFSVYFFISFTFFTFMIPVFIKEMNTDIYLYSGLASLISTLVLICIIYAVSPSTRAEIKIVKLVGLILGIFILINTFYLLKLIPPVPLALEKGIVAHNIRLENNDYVVSYEEEDWYIFWRDHKLKFTYVPNEDVYIFSSIFAPTGLEKSMIHRWTWYNDETNEWELVEDLGFDITGGRNGGFRGYTYKNNVKPGIWKVLVLTDDELLLGVIDFEITTRNSLPPSRVVEKRF